MKIAVIGAGYVGLVTGACLADSGHDVICVDKIPEKIEKLNAGIMPIYEEGLEELVSRNTKAGRLQFTTDLDQAVSAAQAVFIGVGTPPLETKDGDYAAADLKYVRSAAEEIANAMQDYTVVINKSTVPVGTAQMVAEIIQSTNSQAQFSVVSNPEFLREGQAINDFMKPDRIVVGLSDDKAKAVMQQVYKPLIDRGVTYLETTPETSELIKYAANAFLATKIGFINEMANLCEAVGANVEELSKGIGTDNRIGQAFLKAGPGFGGSCFPKDTEALIHIANEYDAPVSIVKSVVVSNMNRRMEMLHKIISVCKGNVNGKNIAVLGLTFKANTDDVRESISQTIVPELLKAGAQVRVYDPQGMEEFKHMNLDIEYASSVEDCITKADAVIILTEWKEFQQANWKSLKDKMTLPVVIDLRNLLDANQMTESGFDYHCIGKLSDSASDLLRKMA